MLNVIYGPWELHYTSYCQEMLLLEAKTTLKSLKKYINNRSILVHQFGEVAQRR